MKKHYTDTELTNALKRMEIVVDTREQENKHILTYLEERGVSTITRRIRTGDYSAQLDGMTIEDEVVIERKGSLSELAGNVGTDRQRFEAEFLRAKAGNIKVLLLVEDAEWQDIAKGKYRSQVSPKAFEATLMSWSADYNITLIFTPKADSGRMIYEYLYYKMRKVLST